MNASIYCLGLFNEDAWSRQVITDNGEQAISTGETECPYPCADHQGSQHHNAE